MLTCDRATIAAAVAMAACVAKVEGGKPALANILVEWGDTLRIVSHDGNSSLLIVVDGVVTDGPGRAICNAKTMTAALSASDGLSVRMWVEDGMIVADCGDATYRIPEVVGVDAPPMPHVPLDGWSTVPADELDPALDLAIACHDHARASAVLAGVMIATDMQSGALVVTGTDGTRLGETVVPSDGGDEWHAVAPIPAAQAIVRMCRPGSSVGIAYSGSLLYASCDDGTTRATIATRSIDGSYPSYRRLLGDSCGDTLTMRSDDIRAALRRVSAVPSVAKGLSLRIAEDAIEISTIGQTHGAKTTMAARYTGSTLAIGINGSTMAAMLRHYPLDEVVMNIQGPGKGMIWRSDSATYLVMPVILKETT